MNTTRLSAGNNLLLACANYQRALKSGNADAELAKSVEASRELKKVIEQEKVSKC